MLNVEWRTREGGIWNKECGTRKPPTDCSAGGVESERGRSLSGDSNEPMAQTITTYHQVLARRQTFVLIRLQDRQAITSLNEEVSLIAVEVAAENSGQRPNLTSRQ